MSHYDCGYSIYPAIPADPAGAGMYRGGGFYHVGDAFDTNKIIPHNVGW